MPGATISLSDFRVYCPRQDRQDRCARNSCRSSVVRGREIPLAGQRADRTRRRSGGAKRKIVGEVEEMTGRPVSRRQVPLQPKQFGNFHFRRDRAADIAEHVVLRLVDLTGFGDRAMIHPDDDISPLVAGRADRQRIGRRRRAPRANRSRRNRCP